MAVKTTNSLFFRKKHFSDTGKGAEVSPVKEIAWFAQMARDENLSADEVKAVLVELVNFFDEKTAQKEEIIAEIQLAEAFKKVLQEKINELKESIKLKR